MENKFIERDWSLIELDTCIPNGIRYMYFKWSLVALTGGKKHPSFSPHETHLRLPRGLTCFTFPIASLSQHHAILWLPVSPGSLQMTAHLQHSVVHTPESGLLALPSTYFIMFLLLAQALRQLCLFMLALLKGFYF